jgi:DNA-binding CsgD family transcriptional regulator
MFFPIPWAETATCCLALTRSPHQPRYTEADYKAVARFVPHLSRALTLCGLYHRSSKRARAAHALIDGLPLGMVVVGDGEVTLVNETAHSLLGGGALSRNRKGRVSLSMGLVGTALRNLPALSQTNDEPVGIILPGGKGGPLFAIVRQINPAVADPMSTGGDFSTVYFTESRQRIEISDDILGQLFGVTGREASVLSALVRGDDVQAIGRRLAIRPETVRVHLKALMRKTGTAGQADLVRLVLSSSARIAGASVAPDATTPARRNEIVHAVSR